MNRAKMCATGKKPILMMKVDRELPMAQRTRQHVLIAVRDMCMTTTGSFLFSIAIKKSSTFFMIRGIKFRIRIS